MTYKALYTLFVVLLDLRSIHVLTKGEGGSLVNLCLLCYVATVAIAFHLICHSFEEKRRDSLHSSLHSRPI